MKAYQQWIDGLSKPVRIILAVFGIFFFLYRLFSVIEEKASNTNHLLYLIFSVIPYVDVVILVIDIVAMARGNKVPAWFELVD